MSDRSTADLTGRTTTDDPSQQTTVEPVDPSGFCRDYSPAVIRFDEGERTTCAHHMLKDSWVWLKMWNGRRLKIPTRRIEEIEVILTERTKTEGGHSQKRLPNPIEDYLHDNPGETL